MTTGQERASPLGPRPDPAPGHRRHDDRHHHPRPGRKEQSEQDAESEGGRRRDLALAADRPLLAPGENMVPEMRMIDQPCLEPRRRAGETKGREDHERY